MYLYIQSSILCTHPDHRILPAPHNHGPVSGRDDAKGRPEDKGQRLDVRGHIQLWYLQDKAHDKDQSHRGYVEVSQHL